MNTRGSTDKQMQVLLCCNAQKAVKNTIGQNDLKFVLEVVENDMAKEKFHSVKKDGAVHVVLLWITRHILDVNPETIHSVVEQAVDEFQVLVKNSERHVLRNYCDN
ncbi:hypothetical protein TNCV_921151 [Trichonephila clavipes]|nr:hypothetical protein TNCV_921151 [Trichonephila clavipes]